MTGICKAVQNAKFQIEGELLLRVESDQEYIDAKASLERDAQKVSTVGKASIVIAVLGLAGAIYGLSRCGDEAPLKGVGILVGGAFAALTGYNSNQASDNFQKEVAKEPLKLMSFSGDKIAADQDHLKATLTKSTYCFQPFVNLYTKCFIHSATDLSKKQ